jgi:arabinofuranosyltransferase
LIIVTWIKLPGQLRFRSSQFAWNCQNMNEVQVELGKWVNENTPSDAVIAVNDAGALSYFGKRKTIDLLGLNNKAILFNPQLAAGLRFKLATMLEFMERENARYLIIFPSWFPHLVQSPQFEEHFTMLEYRKSENYTICGAPQDLMAVYKLRQ